MRRHGDLEIDEDLEFEHTTWRLQRLGWAAMLVFVVAALAGLLGHGPLSGATAGKGGPLEVRYHRFERYQAPTSIEIVLRGAPTARTGRLRLWMEADWLAGFEVTQIAPAPDHQSASGNRDWIEYDAGPSVPDVIRLHITPVRFGLLRARLGLEGGAPIEFHQLVYP